MRLTAFLMLVFSLHLSAKTFSQTVTLSGRDIPMAEAFRVVKHQTGYVFFYTKDLLRKTKPVNISARQMRLRDFLDAIFRDQPLQYFIREQTIVVEEKAVAYMPVAPAVQEITGTIVHAGTNEPLAGATISVKGAQTVAISDQSGRFSIQANIGDVLIVSYVGFQSKEIRIAAANTGTSALAPAQTALSEIVINKGYYTTTSKLNTGNVSRISAEEIERQPVNNPLLALQGRVPGLNITQTNGLPGSSVNIEIRGKSSLNAGTGPLYIIDGVPYPPNTVFSLTNAAGEESAFISINPADIASMEILKDADATAIYGSRGANGVILITTKKAKAGKISLEASFSSGFNQVPAKAKLMSTEQYLQMRRDAYRIDNVTPTAANAPDLVTWDQHASTDWQELLVGKIGRFSDAQVSVSGGNNNARVLFSAGYHKESTAFAPSHLGNERFSTRLNTDLNSNDMRFNMNASISYSVNKTDLPMHDRTQMAFQMPPNYPLYNVAGDLNWDGGFVNPISFLYVSSESKSNNLIANAALRYNLLPGLDVRANIGYNRRTSDQQSLTPLISQNPATATSSSRFADNTTDGYIIEPQLDYKLTIGGSQFSALVGSTWQQTKNANLAVTATGFASDAFLANLKAAGSIVTNDASSSHYRYNSIFTRIGYSLKDKYLANLTFRRDGSSRFGPGRKFGNFGALGLAWIFSEETLIREHLPFLSFGKLRGSYGLTGNDAIGDYRYLSTYTPATISYQGAGSLWPAQVANASFGWEENRKLELALELGFLENRISFSGSYYRNRSDNSLIGYSLPNTTGFTSYQANFPALVENRGWEFILNTTNIKTQHFTWETSFNIAANDNELVAFPGIESTSYANLYAVGASLYRRRMLHFTGVDPQTGLAQFEDVNKDGMISWIGTNTDLKYYDNGLNAFAGGLNNALSYKRLRLDFLLEFVKRKGLNSTGNTILGAMNNRYASQAGYWKQPGDVTGIPRPSATPGNAGYTSFQNWLMSDAEYGDASFIKLRNVSLYYTLPEAWLQKVRARKVDVFARAQNLFSIASFKSLDPETGNLVIPPLRVVTAGINCQF